MGELNVGNRMLAIMDNLPFLRSLNNECIDLIAIDPPFAANETFTGNPRPPSATPNTPRKLPWPRLMALNTTKGRAKPASTTSGAGTRTFIRPGR